ncbi:MULTISPECIES: hypothetical protein [Clostridia]|uniref:Phage protein n=1 Tax=Tepidibacter hydrothermalis TaxID=3036126 RepID=A0ABY8ELH5_9FIRM|nr:MULTISPECIES: hypothetical protein [Clostridia]WFD12193.1 hypothetical protein P4S50_08945 [Tepidibacter hydrothermalis]
MEILKRIAKLIDVKSIISIISAVIFAILAIRGELGVDNTMILLTLVFQSFFSYQNTKPKDGEK